MSLPADQWDVGVQVPAYSWVPVPDADRDLLDAAVEFNDMIGLPPLAPWQLLVLGDWLGCDAAGRWATTEWTLIVPRQNGKTHLAILRMLFGLLVLRERQIVFTTHNFSVTKALMDDIRKIIMSSDLLMPALVVSLSNGNERISTSDGRGTIRFKARTRHGPRGLSKVDVLIFDEAFLLEQDTLEAFSFTQAASRNPSTLFLSSAGDQSSGLLLERRRAGHQGGSIHAGFHEWCADPQADPGDRREWLRANPGIGFALRVERVAQEWETSRHSPRSFARERLGLWPVLTSAAKAIRLEHFKACLASRIHHPPAGALVSFALDIEFDRSAASVACAWRDDDGVDRVAVVQHAPNSALVLRRMPEIIGRVADLRGAAWAVRMRPARDVREAYDRLLADERMHASTRDDAVRQLTWPEYASTCQGFAAALAEQAVEVDASGSLAAAVMDAIPKYDRDGGWVFERTRDSAPNSSLVAAAIAWWTHRKRIPSAERPRIW
jgi:hypothetical protein